jgi:hypothetical protein
MASTLALAIFATGASAGISFIIQAPVAPPPSRTETRQAAPFRDAVWIDGRWAWKDGQYLWVNGHWEHRPGGLHGWQRGQWHHEGSVWVFQSGKWY